MGDTLLRIALLGRFSIQNEGVQEPTKLTHAARSLLAYLLVFRNRIHNRDALANLFWESFSQKRARNCLNTTVWRLRRFLEPSGVSPGTYLISTPTGELGFNVKSNYWLDVDIFENRVEKILNIPIENVDPEDISLLETSAQLYMGDLLEGYYCDWALRERERLRCCYLDCLYFLMRIFSRSGETTRALAHGQEILAIDPLREDVHRQLMRLYIHNGQRSLAVRQYRACQKSLQTELSIPPMPETQALFHRITDLNTPAQGDDSPLYDIDQAVEKLYSAMQNVSSAQKDLEQALKQLVKTTPR